MRVELPGLAVEIPDDWENHTAYQFVSPSPPSLAVPLAGASTGNVTPPRSSIVISYLDVGDDELEQHVGLELEGMRQTLPGLKLVSHGPRAHPEYGEAYAFDTEFEVMPGVVAHQSRIYLTARGAGRGVVVTLTADSTCFDKERERLGGIFQSIRLVD